MADNYSTRAPLRRYAGAKQQGYCAACGMPDNVGLPHGHYEDPALAAKVKPGGVRPSAGKQQFKLGG